MVKYVLEDLVGPTFGQYDLVLVGDGSGTIATKPCGWACFAFEKAEDVVVRHFGGTNGGTNNYAELSPYLHAMWSYHTRRSPSSARVFVVSDSELTVKCASGENARNANLSLWASYDWFTHKAGYSVMWKHVPRNSNVLSQAADDKAGEVRRALNGLGGFGYDSAVLGGGRNRGFEFAKA